MTSSWTGTCQDTFLLSKDIYENWLRLLIAGLLDYVSWMMSFDLCLLDDDASLCHTNYPSGSGILMENDPKERCLSLCTINKRYHDLPRYTVVI